MGQPRRLSVSAFPGRYRQQGNKALRLELKNWPYSEVANSLNNTEIALNQNMVVISILFFYPIHLCKLLAATFFFYHFVHPIKGSFIDCT